jgi:hypothetical protein
MRASLAGWTVVRWQIFMGLRIAFEIQFGPATLIACW